MLAILLTLSIGSPELGMAPDPPRLHDGEELPEATTLVDGGTVLPTELADAMALYLERWQQYPARCQVAITQWGRHQRELGEARLAEARADWLARTAQLDPGMEGWKVALIVTGSVLAVGAAAFAGGMLCERAAGCLP